MYTSAVPAGAVLAKAQSARVHVLQAPSGAFSYAFVKKGELVRANSSPSYYARYGNSTWEAQIAVTTDGGATWNTSFSRVGQFYFNGIEATSTTQACAVGESDSGTYIWCTNDGGATWTETLLDPDANSSLTDIAAVGPNELWATGGEMGALGPKAPTWYHTVDGGASWNVTATASMPFQYGALRCAVARMAVHSARPCPVCMLATRGDHPRLTPSPCRHRHRVHRQRMLDHAPRRAHAGVVHRGPAVT